MVNVVIAVAEGDAASWVREAGHEVMEAASGSEARHLAGRHSAEAVVFDPRLTGDGFPAELRGELPRVATLAFLPIYSSSRAAELLESGSDDVIHGAMPRRETVARLQAAVRRAQRPTSTAGAELGPLRVDAAHGEASWKSKPIRLTRRERQVLQVLVEAEARPVRREEIYRLVWGYAMARGDRTVDVNVRRLRAKRSAAAGEELTIETQPGIGYRLELATEDQPVTTL